MAHLFRRVDGAAGTWTPLAANARSPYLDADGLAAGTLVEYYVQLATHFDYPLKRHGEGSSAAGPAGKNGKTFPQTEI